MRRAAETFFSGDAKIINFIYIFAPARVSRTAAGLRLRELNGNAVKVCNSSRCCKSRFAAMVVTDIRTAPDAEPQRILSHCSAKGREGAPKDESEYRPGHPQAAVAAGGESSDAHCGERCSRQAGLSAEYHRYALRLQDLNPAKPAVCGSTKGPDGKRDAVQRQSRKRCGKGHHHFTSEDSVSETESIFLL